MRKEVMPGEDTVGAAIVAGSGVSARKGAGVLGDWVEVPSPVSGTDIVSEGAIPCGDEADSEAARGPALAEQATLTSVNATKANFKYISIFLSSYTTCRRKERFQHGLQNNILQKSVLPRSYYELHSP
jgi:hypothetical protein